VAIRSLYLKEASMIWLRKQWAHDNGEYSSIGFVSTFGGNTEPPLFLVGIGQQRIVTSIDTGLLAYDIFTNTRTAQITKDIEITVECVSTNNEESLSIAEILVDKIYKSPYRMTSSKLNVERVHRDAIIASTVPKRYGERGYFMTLVSFSVRVSEVVEVKKEEVV